MYGTTMSIYTLFSNGLNVHIHGPYIHILSPLFSDSPLNHLEYIIDELKDVELTWKNNKSEFKYVGSKVNFRNIERFIDNETLLKYCEKHPETLYSEKCFKLYIKMLEQYSRNWCD